MMQHHSLRRLVTSSALLSNKPRMRSASALPISRNSCTVTKREALVTSSSSSVLGTTPRLSATASTINRTLSTVTKEESAALPDDQGDRILLERRPIAGTQNTVALWLTLNRPKQTNALTTSTLEDLQRIIDKASTDKWVRAIVIQGAGHAFCGGHDLYQMHNSQGDKTYFERMFAKCSRFMLALSQRVPQPVIAAVNGLATGAGCQLVAACDLAIASEKARFATSGVNLGLFCATPSVPLSRNISRKRAFEMLVTGDFIDANKAADWGLVNQVVKHEELEDAVNKLVESIAQKPPVALSMGKRFFYNQREKSLMAAYDLADYTMAMNVVQRDTEEGIAAFVQKRNPDWEL